MFTRLASAVLVVFLWGIAPIGAMADPAGRVVFSGTWGSGPHQIGMNPAAPDMLPQGPFMGPGGFRIDSSHVLWISDSVHKCIKGFSTGDANQPPHVFPCHFSRLGDLAVTNDEIFVVAMEPRGIHVLDKSTGAAKRHIPIPLVNPGRLLVISADLIALEDPDGGPWLIQGDQAARHTSSALETVGTADFLFGTLYDLDPASRKILQAGWFGPKDEPDLFAVFRRPGGNIAFSRLIGLIDQTPVLVTLTASAPQSLEFSHFDRNGGVSQHLVIPVRGSIHLPSQWLLGAGTTLYAFSADLQGFSVTAYDFPGTQETGTKK